jgi:hypothetical protein
MKKKMTTPQQSPPAEAILETLEKPTIFVEDLISSFSSSEAAPTLAPPTLDSKEDAFGAAVWNSDKRVNGLYSTFNGRNSWMSIAGTGWVKLTTASDSACEAMTILAANARAKNTRIDYAVDGGLTTEMYVW